MRFTDSQSSLYQPTLAAMVSANDGEPFKPNNGSKGGKQRQGRRGKADGVANKDNPDKPKDKSDGSASAEDVMAQVPVHNQP